MRFCVDYHWLNSITRKDTYPLPRVDDSLDLKWARRLVHNHNCIFCSHSGLYEFTVTPFGLCDALATFQRLMETVLHDLARDKCFVYLDDVLVVGKTFEEHASNLREVLTYLREAGLRLKPSKCHLAKV